MATNRNVLYRMFDSDGDLLYVGATTNLGMRIQHHAQTQPWWDEASEIKLQRFDTWEELARAEIKAIQEEDPTYNVIHANRAALWTWKPRGPKGEGSLYRRANGLWVGRIELPPGPDGKRRYRSVSSMDRDTAQRKFDDLKATYELRGANRYSR